MPMCRKCGDRFPFKKWIDGKLKNMKSRKYCLVCSPFGEHNTRKIERPRIDRFEPRRIICKKCMKDFVTKNRSNVCSSCRKSKRMSEHKDRALKIFGKKCQLCGYEKTRRFAFHHVNPLLKMFMISTCWHLRWDLLKSELVKCIMVCKNCHDEIHEGVVDPNDVREIFEKNIARWNEPEWRN